MHIETVSFELIKQISEHIVRTEKQALLLSNLQKWSRLNAALTVLKDTALAIEYYIDTEYPTNVKGKYLFTYGLLQALFLQGDAAKSLSIALFDREIDFKHDYPVAYRVREIRNDVAGHPTNRRECNHITLAQISMSKGYFYYMRDNSVTETSKKVDVDIMAAISETATCINTILQNAVEELNAEFVEYIEKHRGRKMKEIFSTLRYAQEKALLDDVLNEAGYDTTKKMVEQFEKEIVLRYGSVDAVDIAKYWLEEIHELYDLIDNDVPEMLPELRKRVKKYLLQMLFVKLNELEKYCEETDDYFENYGHGPM